MELTHDQKVFRLLETLDQGVISGYALKVLSVILPSWIKDRYPDVEWYQEIDIFPGDYQIGNYPVHTPEYTYTFLDGYYKKNDPIGTIWPKYSLLDEPSTELYVKIYESLVDLPRPSRPTKYNRAL